MTTPIKSPPRGSQFNYKRLSKLPPSVLRPPGDEEDGEDINEIFKPKVYDQTSCVIIPYGIKPQLHQVDPNNFNNRQRSQTPVGTVVRRGPNSPTQQGHQFGFGCRTRRFTAMDYAIVDPNRPATTFAGSLTGALSTPAGGKYEQGIAENRNMVRPQKLHVSALRGAPHIYQAATGRLIHTSHAHTKHSLTPARPEFISTPISQSGRASAPLPSTSHPHSMFHTPTTKSQSAHSPRGAGSVPNALAAPLPFSEPPPSQAGSLRHEVEWARKNLELSAGLRRPVPSSHRAVSPNVEFPSMDWFEQATGIEGMRRSVNTPNSGKKAAKAAEAAAWYPNPVPRMWVGKKTAASA